MTDRRNPPRRKPADRWYGRIGVLSAILLAVGVWISYNANSGVPGQRTYSFAVDVPNADRLVNTNQVRMAGVRVGQVSRVEVVPARTDDPDPRPHARVHVKLQGDTDPIPVDTTAKVRPASILGASYLDLVPGKRTQTIPEGGTLALRNASENVELTDLLDIFDARTSQAIQRGTTSLGGGLAGRGVALGGAVERLNALAPALTRVTNNLADPATGLGSLVRNYEAAISGFAAAQRPLGRLLTDGATTFAAFAARRSDLGELLDTFPASAATTTRALRNLRPALDDIADISVRLRPAAQRLPDGLQSANGLFRAALPPLRRVPRLSADLTATAQAVTDFSRDPATSGVLRRTGDVLEAAGPLLETLAEAQQYCNSVSLFGLRWIDAFGTLGTGDGPSLAYAYVKSLGAGPMELIQNDRPLPNLHTNYNPNQNRNECEANNEPYDPGKQLLTNPPGFQSNETVGTFTDDAVTERARQAGLLRTPPEDR